MYQTIVLSASGAKSFFETMENPPEPNDKLKAAAKRYYANNQSTEGFGPLAMRIGSGSGEHKET